MFRFEIDKLIKGFENKLNSFITHGKIIIEYNFKRGFENDGVDENLLIDWYPHNNSSIKVSMRLKDTRINYIDIEGVLKEFTENTQNAITETDYRQAWPEKLYYVYNGYLTLEDIIMV